MKKRNVNAKPKIFTNHIVKFTQTSSRSCTLYLLKKKSTFCQEINRNELTTQANMDKPTHDEIVKSLTEENAELSESIRSWSENCGQLTNQIAKLKLSNKQLNAEVTQLKSDLGKYAAKFDGHSKDMKYVMGLLEKMTRQNKDLKAENKKLSEKTIGRKDEKHRNIDRIKLIEFENAELKNLIREKDETILFYKEVCNAKVSEVKQLERINKVKQQRDKNENLE